ncbi:hypothetical protein [Klebsiella huaxiensis]|uniref:Uncharacterized protein n=1 Tax=Klebsiella huaxiensis TaxID=2153354 RepID=A0ABT6EB12_9ENTR|nr:hypothetical protein [Klebsiella huaxiensis]MDG1642548.1 hypothetical protein [Klebsiella huaxiensis]
MTHHIEGLGRYQATMLKLYIYGYLNRIQSSRRVGSELQNRFTVIEDGLGLQIYFNNIACRDCSERSKCTTSKRGDSLPDATI